MRKSHYLAIDGYRGFAAMVIVLFHFNLPGLHSGFLGVDIFFVISGFVITLKLLSELEETGHIDFVGFYANRIQRLVPSVFVVGLVSLLFGWLLLKEDLLIELSWSFFAALGYFSNIFFFFEADYFDTSAASKPLLHTWSLSVEEQFYFLWPLILLGLSKLGTLNFRIVVVLALCLVSMISAELARLYISKEAAFYLLHARLFELATGGALAFIALLAPTRKYLGNAIVIASVVTILIALALLTEDSALPGLLTLVIVIPTLGLIYSCESPFAKLLFANRLALLLGRISYTIYLIHWPVFVFWKSIDPGELTILDTISLTLISLVLAFVLHKLVETPFRQKRQAQIGRWVPLGGALVITFLAWGGAEFVDRKEGFSARIPESRQLESVRAARKKQRALYCSSPRKSLPSEIVNCPNERGKEKDIFVWGDSHAQHLVAGVHTVFSDHNVFTLRLSGCDPFAGFDDKEYTKANDRKCVSRNKDALDMFESLPPTKILFSWSVGSDLDGYEAGFTKLVPLLEELGHQVAILTDFTPPGLDLPQCIRVPSYIISDEIIAQKCQPISSFVRSRLKRNRELVKRLSQNNVPFVDAASIQCPNENCTYFSGKDLLYRDTHHLNDFGAEYFLSQISERLKLIFEF